jgi:hypothetical protein
MVGDDLTIALFLIGLAATISMTGITQAGWKNQLLIKSLFVIPALLLCVGLAWFFPGARSVIAAVATHPVSWFVTIMFGLGAVLFRTPSSIRAPVASVVPPFPARDAAQNQETFPRATRILTPLDVFLEINDAPDITYKRKLRIIIRNDTETHITIRSATSWIRRNIDDIENQPQDRYLWQMEQYPGAWQENKWRQGEVTELSIPPGYAVWTYIGVHDQATHRGIGRRLVQGRLGVLVLVLTIDGQLIEKRMPLGPIPA